MRLDPTILPVIAANPIAHWGVKCVRNVIEITSKYEARIIDNIVGCNVESIVSKDLTPTLKFSTTNANLVMLFPQITWTKATRDLLHPVRAFKRGIIVAALTTDHVNKCNKWIRKGASRDIVIARVLCSTRSDIVRTVLEIMTPEIARLIAIVTRRYVPPVVADMIYDITRNDFTTDVLKRMFTGKSQFTSATTMCILVQMSENIAMYEWMVDRVSWVDIIIRDPTIIRRYPAPWTRMLSRREIIDNTTTESAT